MAQLLLIKSESLSSTDNRQVNDIVGVFDDAHVFSDHEKLIFDIVQVKDVSKESIYTLQPETREVARSKSGDWDFEENLERKNVWKTPEGDYKEIVTEPRLKLSYLDGMYVNNYTKYVENTQNVLVAKTVVAEPIVKG